MAKKNSASNVDRPDHLAPALKMGIRELTASIDPKSSQAYTMALMTALFYDIQDAVDAGVTLRDVHRVFVAAEVPLPFTRFTQDLTRLRAVFPARHKVPVVDEASVEAIAIGLGNLRKQEEAVTVVLPRQAASSSSAKAATERARRFVAVVAPRARQAAAAALPMDERMKICAKAVLDLAQGVEADPGALSIRLRASLGHGWTIETACQFVLGSPYQEWLSGPWSDAEVLKALSQARAVAEQVVGLGKTLPPRSDLASSAVAAWKRLDFKGGTSGQPKVQRRNKGKP